MCCDVLQRDCYWIVVNLFINDMSTVKNEVAGGFGVAGGCVHTAV